MEKFIRVFNKIIEIEIAMILEIFMNPVYTIVALVKG